MFVLYIFRTNTFPTSSTGNRIRQLVQSLNWFLMMTLFQQRERNEASFFGEALISFSGSLSTRFDFARKILFEQAKPSSLWNDQKIVSQYTVCVSNYQSCQLCPSDYNEIPWVVGQFGTGQFGTRTIWHQHNKHCQRHYGPRCWLLWPVILVRSVRFSMLGSLSFIWFGRLGLAGLVW